MKSAEDELRRAIADGCLIQDDSVYAGSPVGYDWSKPVFDEEDEIFEEAARECDKILAKHNKPRPVLYR